MSLPTRDLGKAAEQICTFPRDDGVFLPATSLLMCFQMIQNFHGHTGDVFAIDVPKCDTGNVFISAGADKHSLVWDIRTGQCVQVSSYRFLSLGACLSTATEVAKE